VSAAGPTQEPRLKSQRFRIEREGDWRRLEALLSRVERGRLRGLTDDELLEIPVLYRACLSSVSVARATSLDANLIAYLESLATRAYFFVYGARARPGERLRQFFRHDWPAAVQALWRETLIATLILGVAAVIGYALVVADPDWYGSIMGGMGQGRDPTASTTFLRKVLYDDHGGEGLATFAVSLFTHNAQVSILAFALGFAFCLPTALLAAQNGLTLGALMALYVSRGLGLQLGGWLVIHGATELFASLLGAAAGFRIGWAVLFPGSRSRLDAARAAVQVAGAAMAGVVVMLIFAGLLEGVGRQLIQADMARYAIGAAMLTLWLAYFYLPRRSAGRL
jgi:uncharacterized membrane protein SpoIIM required for sporulation